MKDTHFKLTQYIFFFCFEKLATKKIGFVIEKWVFCLFSLKLFPVHVSRIFY